MFLGGRDGAPGRNRTCDLRIRSPTLYPTELQARLEGGKIKLMRKD